MSVVVLFSAGPHSEARSVPSVTAPSIGAAAVAIVIDPGQTRTRETLCTLLDELERVIALDRIALHSLRAQG